MVAATQYSFIQPYATSDCARALLRYYNDAIGISNCKEEKLNSIGPRSAKLWDDAK